MSNYKLLQQRIKLYKQAGYSHIPLNSSKKTLDIEYNRLLELELSQDLLEKAIINRKADQVKALNLIELYTFPQKYSLGLIKAKTFLLAEVNNLQELLQNYPILKDQSLDFRYKLSWIECLRIITEITEESLENKAFYQAIERAIEIEIKSKDDEFYRHETPDPDLLTLLCDHKLVGVGWEKNKSVNASLKRAYAIRKCEEIGLNLEDFF